MIILSIHFASSSHHFDSVNALAQLLLHFLQVIFFQLVANLEQFSE